MDGQTQASEAGFYLPKRLIVLGHKEQRLVINPEVANWVRLDVAEYRVLEALSLGHSPETIAGDGASASSVSLDVAKQSVYRTCLKLLMTHMAYQANGHGLNVRIEDSVQLKVVYYAVIQACNLHCPYCYADAGHRLIDELNISESLNLIDQVVEIGAQEIVFSGGEPTLRRDLSTLVEHAARLGLKVGLITNGTLLDRKMALSLSHYVSTVTVSLDGASAQAHDQLRGEGSFDKTCQALVHLREAGIHVALNATLTPLNSHEIIRLHELAQEMDAMIRPSWQMPMGRGKAWGGKNLSRQARPLLEELLAAGGSTGFLSVTERARLINDGPPLQYTYRKRCAIANSEIAVGAQGNVYPCRLMQRPQFCAGNVRDEPLSKIYHDSAIMKQCRSLVTDDMPKCRKCYLSPFCGGGCPAVSFAYHGDLRHPPAFICFLRRFELELGMWLKAGYQPYSLWERWELHPINKLTFIPSSPQLREIPSSTN